MSKKKNKKTRIPFHPVYGYMTSEQWEQLKTLGLGPTRDVLMAQIERQTKNKGEV